jgi:hypothetical protein
MCSISHQIEDILNDKTPNHNVTNITDIGYNRLLAEIRNGNLGSPCLIIVTASYIFGMIGNFIALVHLWHKQNFKNTKHSLMLK